MADHGTLVARDGTQDIESFSSIDYDHPMEPVSDFGGQHTATYFGPW